MMVASSLNLEFESVQKFSFFVIKNGRRHMVLMTRDTLRKITLVDFRISSTEVSFRSCYNTHGIKLYRLWCIADQCGSLGRGDSSAR